MSDSAHPALATFRLYREHDVTGISGEGVIAEGVQFSDGWVVTHWLDQPPMWEPKTDVWHHKGTHPIAKIHGHDGATRIVWTDEFVCPAQLPPALVGIVPGGPCVARGPHTEHKTADGTAFTDIEDATAPAKTCSAQYTGVLPVGECIRAAGHSPATDHTDDRGRNFGGRLSEYPATGSQAPPNQGPLTGIEVRDPCPWCEDCPLIPLTLMDDHIREHHPEVREGGPGIPVPDAEPEPVRFVQVDGVLADGGADAAREALRQMDADPHGLKAGMVVKPYTEYGQQKWVFRCWGTDTCDGFLSLDHYSQLSAERARDRHAAEEHPEATVTVRLDNSAAKFTPRPDGGIAEDGLRRRCEQLHAQLDDAEAGITEAVRQRKAAEDRARRAEGERSEAAQLSHQYRNAAERAKRDHDQQATALADAQQLISMLGDLIGAERRIVMTAMGHREDQGVRREACDGCGRDHMAELETVIATADKAYAVAFPPTADGPARPGRLPDGARLTPRQRAYEATNAYIESLGDRLPSTRSARTAHIWQAVNTALEAAGHAANPETLCRLPHEMEV